MQEIAPPVRDLDPHGEVLDAEPFVLAPGVARRPSRAGVRESGSDETVPTRSARTKRVPDAYEPSSVLDVRDPVPAVGHRHDDLAHGPVRVVGPPTRGPEGKSACQPRVRPRGMSVSPLTVMALTALVSIAREAAKGAFVQSGDRCCL